MIFLSRLIAASVYAGAAFFFGSLLGERGELGFVQQVFLAVIPLATIVLAFVSRDARIPVLATGLAMLLGVLFGQQRFERAWNDCNRRAHLIREAVIQHHARTGGYPARLDELSIDSPCHAILHYLSNDRGFRLWYTNDREHRIATHREPFTASGKSSDRSPQE